MGGWGFAWGGGGGGGALGCLSAACEMLASEGEGGLIGQLNRNPAYDGTILLNNHLNADTDNLLNINIGSNYFDFTSFSQKFTNSKKPLYLSVNIQCLLSKFDSIKSFHKKYLRSISQWTSSPSKKLGLFIIRNWCIYTVFNLLQYFQWENRNAGRWRRLLYT